MFKIHALDSPKDITMQNSLQDAISMSLGRLFESYETLDNDNQLFLLPGGTLKLCFKMFTLGQIATKNGQLQPDLVVAIPFLLQSKCLNETQVSHGCFCFLFINNGTSGVI